MTYAIHTIKTLEDNYTYLIENTQNGYCAAIDCGDSRSVIRYIENFNGTIAGMITQQNPLIIQQLWLTHHHWDHTDGAVALKKYTGCDIIGSKDDFYRLPFLDKTLHREDAFLFYDLKVKVLETWGHTVGHIGFYVPQLQAFFSGDSLFTLGCGRIFEGTPDMYFESLQRIKNLPDETRLYGGHEYTKNNMKLTDFLIKYNSITGWDCPDFQKEWQEYKQELTECIDSGIPTVPSFLDREKKFNPYLQAQNTQQFDIIRNKKHMLRAKKLFGY